MLVLLKERNRTHFLHSDLKTNSLKSFLTAGVERDNKVKATVSELTCIRSQLFLFFFFFARPEVASTQGLYKSTSALYLPNKAHSSHG